MRKKWKEQEVCKHEYGEPSYTLYGYGIQCRICHYIQILKAPTTPTIQPYHDVIVSPSLKSLSPVLLLLIGLKAAL
jgi:hypothetical protein